jgi:hypothetical protein
MLGIFLFESEDLTLTFPIDALQTVRQSLRSDYLFLPQATYLQVHVNPKFYYDIMFTYNGMYSLKLGSRASSLAASVNHRTC